MINLLKKVLEMNIEKTYDGVASARLDHIWFYGLDVSNPVITVNGEAIEATKFEYNAQVLDLLVLFIQILEIVFSMILISVFVKIKSKVLKMNNLELPIGADFRVEISAQKKN